MCQGSACEPDRELGKRVGMGQWRAPGALRCGGQEGDLCIQMVLFLDLGLTAANG